jgi:DNA-binding transcriptional regulator GbsR (MarR family)
MNAIGPAARKFVLHWGEMGARWGINRTVAQVHALLYLSEQPLNAEQICEELDLARSNVSVALKELQGWGIVKLVHLKGDRRDHFESLKDVFEMFRIIAMERKRREIDPTLRLIRECLEEAEKPKAADAHVRERLKSMQEFFELAETSAAQLDRLPTGALVKLAKMGDKALRLLGLAGS